MHNVKLGGIYHPKKWHTTRNICLILSATIFHITNTKCSVPYIVLRCLQFGQKEICVDAFSVINSVLLNGMSPRPCRTKNKPLQLWFSELRCSKNKSNILGCFDMKRSFLWFIFHFPISVLSQVFVKRGSLFQEQGQSCYFSLLSWLLLSSQNIDDFPERFRQFHLIESAV
jgi:hypothetical protein